jgi:D-threo-aldose 1-dehydrogenase
MEAFFGSGYARLMRLKEAGRIGAFGLGVNEVDVCLQVMDHGPIDAILLAGRLTRLDRAAEAELVPRCLADGTSLVLGGVFNSGILATGPKPGATFDYAPASPEILAQVAALQARAEAAGVTLARAALEFARRHPAAASVLLGTARVSSLQRNLEALATPFPPGADAVLA